jgi:Protein of unknown function (DUF2752)
MQIVFRKRTTGEIEYGIIFGGLSLVALGIARIMPVLSLAPSCFFKTITGIPCPTCGATRSVVYLASGEIAAAILMNPLIALCVLAAILIFFLNLVALAFDLPRINIVLTTEERNAMRSSVIILTLVQWAFLIITS